MTARKVELTSEVIIFENGFANWYETFFEVSSFIEQVLNSYDDPEHSVINKVQEAEGRGGLYELARKWTNLFEIIHKGKTWDGEFFEEIEKFLQVQNSYQPTGVGS